MQCERCGERLKVSEGRGRRARFCGTACRVAAHRAKRQPLPVELTCRPRWVRHDEAKRPLTIFGTAASVTDARTWTSFERVRSSSVGVGLGIVLGSGLGCIDLDHCISGGVIASWAQEIIARHRGEAYLIERSRSREGIHIFLPMSEARGSKIRDGRNIEVYSQARYIAVTGDRI